MACMEIGRSDSTDLSLPASDLLGEACRPKKRMDWSEFMDPVEETEDGKNKQNGLSLLYYLICLHLYLGFIWAD